jgi:hypothetical protein
MIFFPDEYTATYEPDDQMEWYLVLGEIKAFIEADTIVNVLDSDSNSIVLSHRLNPLITPPVERSPIMTLSLQEVRTFLFAFYTWLLQHSGYKCSKLLVTC